MGTPEFVARPNRNWVAWGPSTCSWHLKWGQSWGMEPSTWGLCELWLVITGIEWNARAPSWCLGSRNCWQGGNLRGTLSKKKNTKLSYKFYQNVWPVDSMQTIP